MDTTEEDRLLNSQIYSQYIMKLDQRLAVLPTSVLERYVGYVEDKNKGILGGLCLKINVKYQAASSELTIRKEDKYRQHY